MKLLVLKSSRCRRQKTSCSTQSSKFYDKLIEINEINIFINMYCLTLKMINNC